MTTTISPTTGMRTLLGTALKTIRGKLDGSGSRRYPALQPVPFAWL